MICVFLLRSYVRTVIYVIINRLKSFVLYVSPCVIVNILVHSQDLQQHTS
jgi:hypothetical protein